MYIYIHTYMHIPTVSAVYCKESQRRLVLLTHPQKLNYTNLSQRRLQSTSVNFFTSDQCWLEGAPGFSMAIAVSLSSSFGLYQNLDRVEHRFGAVDDPVLQLTGKPVIRPLMGILRMGICLLMMKCCYLDWWPCPNMGSLDGGYANPYPWMDDHLISKYGCVTQVLTMAQMLLTRFTSR